MHLANGDINTLFSGFKDNSVFQKGVLKMLCSIPNTEANNVELNVFETEALNRIESLGNRLMQ